MRRTTVACLVFAATFGITGTGFTGTGFADTVTTASATASPVTVSAKQIGTGKETGHAARVAGKRAHSARHAGRRHAGGRAAGRRTKTVRFGGYAFEVPARWPVYRLGPGSTRCVRYDTSAVYLGTPGVNQQCPAHLVGTADTVSIAAPAPAGGSAETARGSAPAAVLQSAQVGGAPVPQQPGVAISTTYGADPGLVRRVLRSLRAVGTGEPVAVHQAAPLTSKAPARAPATPAASSPASTPTPAPTRTLAPTPTASLTVRSSVPMRGFDTCTAPSLDAMRAWRKTYSAAAVYIGGADMACGYGNLSASWVRSVKKMGWSLIPIYVGLQAPCNSFGQEIQPRHAAAEGIAAADAAMFDAKLFGMGRGTPVYFDMEAYNSGSTICRDSVLSFLDKWTRELHAHGYVSGVYSSAASGAEDLGTATSVYGRQLAKPDSLWFALWDNRANLIGMPYLLDSWWNPGRRIKQYEGGHWVKVSGVGLSIDSDWVQGAVY